MPRRHSTVTSTQNRNTRNSNSSKGQGRGRQRRVSPQQLKPRKTSDAKSNPSRAASMQRRHASKTKTPLRQPSPQVLETKPPPPPQTHHDPLKSAEVRVTENMLEEQQPGMALLTPHGRYRLHSRVVSYIDIVFSIIYAIYIVVSIALMFNEEQFVTDVVMMSTVALGALSIVLIFFEVCIAAGLLKATDPQANRYDAMAKAGCWQYYEFFMTVFSIGYGSLCIYVNYPISGGFALMLAIWRCIGIIIVFMFIRDLKRKGEELDITLLVEAKKREQKHGLVEVANDIPNAN